MPARPRVTTTRRTALGGTLLAVGAVAGCDLDLDPPPDEPRGPRDRPDADPDAALVERTLTELDQLLALVDATHARFPTLREPMTGLRDLHLAHRATLGQDAPPDSPPDSPAGARRRPAGAPEALAQVRTREQRAQRLLADWSVAADSGALARLLAAMSAGVAQRLALLPVRVGEST